MEAGLDVEDPLPYSRHLVGRTLVSTGWPSSASSAPFGFHSQRADGADM